jgi:hypothetical protein
VCEAEGRREALDAEIDKRGSNPPDANFFLFRARALSVETFCVLVR